MGDLTSRCGELEDSIEGVDHIPPRHVIDYMSNDYGELLCDMLISANMCILNRRGDQNDFTCNSVSIVDYVLILHEQLEGYEYSKVVKTDCLFESSSCVGVFDPLRHIPDHNMLQWSIFVNFEIQGYDMIN